MDSQAPQLAKYRAIADYQPAYGDLIIKLGIFSATFGFVVGYSKESSSIQVIWEGHPRLLLTMSDTEQTKRTKSIPLDTIKANWLARYSILQRDKQANDNIYFI